MAPSDPSARLVVATGDQSTTHAARRLADSMAILVWDEAKMAPQGRVAASEGRRQTRKPAARTNPELLVGSVGSLLNDLPDAAQLTKF